MTLPTVASLWIGGNISFLEQVCLQSFVDHGHRTLLYTYGDVVNAPPGVEVLDAEAIYPTAQMVRHKNGSPAPTADIFRYQLLKEQGAYADVLAGRIRTAIGKTNDIWASLTGSPYGQKTHAIETLLNAYQKAGGVITD